MSEGQNISVPPEAAVSTPSRLRMLLNAATPGPWAADVNPDRVPGVFDLAYNDNDCELMAAAVNALPALLDVVEAAAKVEALSSPYEHHEDDSEGHDDRTCAICEEWADALWALEDALAALDNKEPRPSGDSPESPGVPPAVS